MKNLFKPYCIFAFSILLMASIPLSSRGNTWCNASVLSFTIDTCEAPTSIIINDITINSAVVSWSAGNSETSWSIEHKKSSDSTYSTPITCNAPTYTLTNLSSATDYDVRIKSICDSATESIGKTAHFKTMASVIQMYKITPVAGNYGTITPYMTVVIAQGANQQFTFTPDEGYKVKQILVNGDYVGDTTSYTIKNIQQDLTIRVDFELINSIDQHTLNQHVTIYPNPIKENLTVKLTTPFEQIEILNLLGQVVHTSTVNDQEFVINVADYKSGVYFIRLNGKSGIATKKIVKE